jgi:hypothetical protein
VAAGLTYPRWVVAEAPGSTALTSGGAGTYGALYRVDLTQPTNNLSLVAELDLAALAIEPGTTPAGHRTALGVGPESTVLWRSIYRVNLDTGGLDLLAPTLFDSLQSFALDAAGTTAWFTERKAASSGLRGGFYGLPLP